MSEALPGHRISWLFPLVALSHEQETDRRDAIGGPERFSPALHVRISREIAAADSVHAANLYVPVLAEFVERMS